MRRKSEGVTDRENWESAEEDVGRGESEVLPKDFVMGDLCPVWNNSQKVGCLDKTLCAAN